MKKNNIIKNVNFIAMIMLAIAYIAFMAQGTYGVHFSDTAVRAFGIMTLLALPAVTFTTVKIKKAQRQ